MESIRFPQVSPSTHTHRHVKAALHWWAKKSICIVLVLERLVRILLSLEGSRRKRSVPRRAHERAVHAVPKGLMNVTFSSIARDFRMAWQCWLYVELEPRGFYVLAFLSLAFRIGTEGFGILLGYCQNGFCLGSLRTIKNVRLVGVFDASLDELD